MVPLQDVTWIKHLYSANQVERFDRGRFRVAAVALPETAMHHNERYRFRLLFFEATTATPVMAVNIESDMLGGWHLTLQTGSSRKVAASYDRPPAYEDFRVAALALADAEIAAQPAAPPATAPRKPRRRARTGG